jgi:hypothetical protein
MTFDKDDKECYITSRIPDKISSSSLSICYHHHSVFGHVYQYTRQKYPAFTNSFLVWSFSLQ